MQKSQLFSLKCVKNKVMLLHVDFTAEPGLEYIFWPLYYNKGIHSTFIVIEIFQRASLDTLPHYNIYHEEFNALEQKQTPFFYYCWVECEERKIYFRTK